MPEPAPEPELQASADLSPVSPSPVHTAPSLAVPALQDTVDTINAMVAAAVAPDGHSTIDPTLADTGDDHGHVVDDDTFSDDYAAAPHPAPDVAQRQQQQQQPATQVQIADAADDYAKTFDSDVEDKDRDDGHDSSAQQTAAQGQTATSADTQPTAEAQPIHNAKNPENEDDRKSDSGPSLFNKEAAVDIQRLMTELTSQTASKQTGEVDPGAAQVAAAPNEAKNPSSSALPSPASLPPRPPMPLDSQVHHPENYHPGQANAAMTGAAGPESSPGQRGSLPAAPKSVSKPQNTLDVAQSASVSTLPYPSNLTSDYEGKWEQFVADERHYMTEARWDRFPEGSRIFIGNLTSEPVNKRDIFDVFHKFGRIAQISLKSAYGFVQYHNADEGRAAIHHLEGVDIKGRRVHLEVSKVQDKSKKDRARSPDRGRRDSGRDGRRNNRNNDGRGGDYRGGRGSSLRRGSDHYGREDSYSHGRHSYDGGRERRRTRSPSDYGRPDAYRRRSPSPLPPKRYGPDVPEVQILLQPGISRDSVWWLEEEFKNRGLAKSILPLQDWEARQYLVRHYAQEGVLGVVEVDYRALHQRLIPLQVFKRNEGKFDEYVDIRPDQAAQLVYNAKYPPPSVAQPSYAQPTHPQTNTAELAGLLANADPATIQQLMATLQASGQGGQQHAPVPGPPQPAYGAQPAQPDLQSVLASLGAGQYGAPQAPAPQQQYAPQYGGGYQPSAPTGSDTAALQNIMAQLNRRS